MVNKSLPLSFAVLVSLVATSCIDNNYDLSDIDTSVEVPVNNLVIPVNFSPVTLNSIIDIDNSESITKEKTPDGKEIYVYSYLGTFGEDSKDIVINDFKVIAPVNVQPSIVNAKLPNNPNARRKAPGGGTIATYNLGTSTTSFNYKIKDVDSEVQGIEKIITPKITLGAKLKVPGNVTKDCKEIEFKNMKMKFPKGLYVSLHDNNADASVGEYNAQTGEIIISSYKTSSGEMDIALNAEVINAEQLGLSLFDHELDFDGDIKVESGEITLTTKDNAINLPTEMDIDIDYDFSDFSVSGFSGKVNYEIDNPDFSPADLSDIPDFLAQDETRIKIDNPQIYISLDNSCAPYGLGGSTGLEITPIREDAENITLKMDEDIVIGTDKGVGPYKFAISPEGQDLKCISEYADAKKYLFSSLRDVLYGDGLPKQIDVNFIKPVIKGETKNFPLGTHIPSVKGEYLFRAPLALTKGSQIVYSGTEDDWNSEALDDLYVKNLELTATVSSTVPLEVRLSADILDKEGKHIGTATATDVPSQAKEFPISINITPDNDQEFISGIDGIFYKAWAISNSPAGQAEVLSPDQTLTLDNIRIKVSGKYLHLDKGDK